MNEILKKLSYIAVLLEQVHQIVAAMRDATAPEKKE